MNNTPEKWNSYYARTQELPPESETREFLSHLPQGARVLDWGCGSGRWAAAFLRDRPDLTIDLVDKHIENATLLPPNWRGEKWGCDFTEFTPTQRYYGVWAFASLFFIAPADIGPVFNRLAGALVQGGIFDFEMVDDCDAARSMRFHGMRQEQVESLVKDAGLDILSFNTITPPYGAKNIPIPTFCICATKPTA